MTLLLEVGVGDGEWALINQHEGGCPGSISNNTPEGREVLRFWFADGYSVVERSIGGADTEVGEARLITTLGFEPVARLEDGETYEFDMRTDRMTSAMHVRFRHER
jgi:hypothetical protein